MGDRSYEIDDFERASRYLEGDLSLAEAVRFEQDLGRPEVARAMAEALILRETLRADPDLAVPEGLADRIADDLVEARPAPETPDAMSALAALRAGLDVFLQGQGLAGQGLRATGAGLRESLSGMDTMRYSLGPLALRAPRPTRRPLWRRLIGR
jgi:hypothetical protein